MSRALILIFAFVAVTLATEVDSSSTQSPFEPTAPQHRPLVCRKCMAIVGLINEVALENTYRTKQTFDDFCDKNFGQTPSGRACKQWLDSDLDKILDNLKNGWSAAIICKHMQKCF